ncbi:MAG: LysR family transcriptional regulator [Roseitalea sp.]|jgi:DNA-binding transcriptional LysR family regulator|nr:LysR family transcriptional regulator [Roseitalea sp.]MBO6720318.1 LysR family transcriptional regulator [Roseitalea sp.]MBO6742678.1 LysR family transcriptional regulator [Roseitalea sp.]
MRHEWLKDLLAVAEAGSFQAAAEMRGVTQPAFSRRLRQIEEQLDAQLFDRSQRPARILPHVAASLEQIRELSDGINSLTLSLRHGGRGLHNKLEIAGQHAITISVAPGLMDRLRAFDLKVRMRSANREDCLALLLIGQVELALVYDIDGLPLAVSSDAIARTKIADDRLVPVFAASATDRLNADFQRGELPIVAYPRDVFLGKVFWNRIAPRLSGAGQPVSRVETALTPAAMQFALAGIGVAWLPRSLVADELARGTLADLSASLPTLGMDLIAVRRLDAPSAVIDRVWERIGAAVSG